MYNKKLIPIFLVFLYILFYVNAATTNEYCTKVNVCPNINPGDYNLNCDTTSDGFCPQNYSTTIWESTECPSGAYGKCVPCDPDCGACGNLDLFVQPVAESCSDITNYITATTSTEAVNLHIFRGQNDYTQLLVSPTPKCNPGSTCEINFEDNLFEYEEWQDGSAECFGGDQYCYSVCGVPPGLGKNCVSNCGRTMPNIIINPNEGSLIGLQTMTLNAQSRLGVRTVALNISKWSEDFGAYRPINVKVPTTHDDYCSFRLTCGQVNCNELIYVDYEETPPGEESPGGGNYQTQVTETATWDTSECENADYLLAGYVFDSYSENHLLIYLETQNQNPPCTDECAIFTSKTLNTILARVKTWITPG